ncbi:MAG: DNA translocase FtsK [Bryobacterales bacterium]|nr:DNA translocase FtsK [Bryobacteraceae bacterium]MDW8353161.1 DNA translocase FtsK [Bryobacterales bacterium]
MSDSSSTQRSRLQEAAGVVYLAVGILFWLSLVSFHPGDPSWNTATGEPPKNLIGRFGSHAADLSLQTFGLGAFLFPILLFVVAWKWLRSEHLGEPLVRLLGAGLSLMSLCAGLGLVPGWRCFSDSVPAGGVVGLLVAEQLRAALNLVGAAIVTATAGILSIYLLSSFSLAKAAAWLGSPLHVFAPVLERWKTWRAARHRARDVRGEAAPLRRVRQAPAGAPPAAEGETRPSAPEPAPQEIPIRTLEDLGPEARRPHPEPPPETEPPEIVSRTAVRRRSFQLPSTELLNETPGRSPFDEQELKETAARIKAKFEEFNVFGNVVQINPGPVVTTFEFKPEAGIKYSRITTLTEDLCLGLQAESILIERIPGKPTVGIEVPNTRREVIGLRQILESEEFQNAPSRLTIPLGKDINGRIKVAALETMPHLLIAGSTGSGKSVMLNSIIMAILFKSTPEDVRMILVDPKRLELGLYEGIPHLLTPVITDPKKATNALRNAVLEMDRRLRLLASQGVRNIEQFNRKVRQLQAEPASVPTAGDLSPEELEPLPYIVILIDELADLMMIERGNVEESVTRLAQMARAVGMHLVVATQRPSVDVITGLIKANFPARISFRVATRVDSRTILDVMGAEHLLGKGDMLFLPPGSSRLVRVHGALVTEREINRVVEFWRQQAQPEYDSTFLVAPPSEEPEEGEAGDAERDPLYEEAVRIVVEMGKASTSILQRRLRLGYGRAARILDMMQREGIIGPPDGSKPREVLRIPDWLDRRGSSG